MSIARAEQLKSDLTDKFVVVSEGVPELRRFSGLTGKVRTVNMNCRALVEFDGAVDIGWYDIDPSFLTVITEPLKKKVAPEKPTAAAKPAAQPAAKPSGKSPLEMARAQGASKVAAAVAAGEKKLSPLEMARQQGAAGAAPAAEGAKKLSPLEQARLQGSAKAAPAPAPLVEEEPAPVVTAAASSGARRETPGSTAEIIALARSQGPFKG